MSLTMLLSDFIADKARNKDDDKYKSKEYLLKLISDAYLDIENRNIDLYESFLDASLYSILDNDVSKKELCSNYDEMTFLTLIQSIIAAKRSLIDKAKYLCHAPKTLSEKRLIACLKGHDEYKDQVYACFNIDKNNSCNLYLKDNLSVNDLRALILILENIGYFSATGYIKGLV